MEVETDGRNLYSSDLSAAACASVLLRRCSAVTRLNSTLLTSELLSHKLYKPHHHLLLPIMANYLASIFGTEQDKVSKPHLPAPQHQS